MSTSYYAVIACHKSGIYTNGKIAGNIARKCNEAVICKKFTTQYDAEKFIYLIIPIFEQIDNKINITSIYTDGSYSNGLTGFGIVIIFPNGF